MSGPLSALRAIVAITVLTWQLSVSRTDDDGSSKPWTAKLFSFSVEVEDEVDVPVNSLPAAVVSSVTTKYPTSTIASAELEREDNEQHYEITVVTNGVEEEVELTADGTFKAS